MTTRRHPSSSSSPERVFRLAEKKALVAAALVECRSRYENLFGRPWEERPFDREKELRWHRSDVEFTAALLKLAEAAETVLGLVDLRSGDGSLVELRQPISVHQLLGLVKAHSDVLRCFAAARPIGPSRVGGSPERSNSWLLEQLEKAPPFWAPTADWADLHRRTREAYASDSTWAVELPPALPQRNLTHGQMAVLAVLEDKGESVSVPDEGMTVRGMIYAYRHQIKQALGRKAKKRASGLPAAVAKEPPPKRPQPQAARASPPARKRGRTR